MEAEDMKICNSSLLDSNSMVSPTMGRVMSTVLSARPKKLNDAISRLDSAPKTYPLAVSLEDSLCILHKYVRHAEKESALDHVLIPMIEHSVKCKDLKRSNQTMILLNWLFQDDDVFQCLATNFASILLRKDDHYISLGWCILVRDLVEDEITKEQLQTGIREKFDTFLKILSSSIKHLLLIACNGSTFQGGIELPTRLSVAAADCVISLTIAVTRKDMVSDIPHKWRKPTKPNAPNQSITMEQPGASNVKKVKPTCISPELSSKMEMPLLLWNLLGEVIILVQKLIAWSRKSRPLHAKGLERVLKWLQKTKHHYGCFQSEPGLQMANTGALLFSSCWKHCSVLLHLEDHKFSQCYGELLNQYLSGIQFYADNYVEELAENKNSGIGTINFFLNCLLLLLGRCNGKQFESAISEYGLQMSRVLISQLYSSDEDVIDGAVCIIKAAMFRTNSSLAASSLADTRQMDTLVPLLLHLLDGRDGAARAAVMLVSECCVISDSQCLEEVLERLAAGNVSQRKNAVDVVSELVHMSLDSLADLSHLPWQDISNHLLERLGDEELVISSQASKLLPMIDPSLVLPPLVRLVYSIDERVQSFACNTFLAVLKKQNKRPDVICLLLDCLSNLYEGLDLPDAASYRKGFKLDTEGVLRMIPEWSKSVEEWNILIGPLVDKVLSEPSNVNIIRFLSCISENLADASDAVFQRLLLHTSGMREIHTKEDSAELQHSLFDRLCPLLIIRLLPLRVFDDLKSSLVYGELLEQHMMQDYRYFNRRDKDCVAALLLNRAFNKFEFEDVRKLAAELCGRIHPHVLCPIISSKLENAANSHDVLTIKACLFAICTALVARGNVLVSHPAMLKIREVLETVLSWPSTDGDEVSKAQHGCIDCLALMVCTELQALQSFGESSLDETHVTGNNSSSDKGNIATRSTVHTYVMRQLTCDQNKYISSSKMVVKNRMLEETLARSFSLSMANVLISACQKISDFGRKPFAKKTLPQIIHTVGVMNDSEIRAACIQILFSAVYNLKSVILPYSSDLLKVSVKSLKEGSEKTFQVEEYFFHMLLVTEPNGLHGICLISNEKMAGAKLMASLMASDNLVVKSISMGLLEARKLLASISSSAETPPDLRLVCQKLLLCLTSP